MYCSNNCFISLIDWQALEYYFLYLGMKKLMYLMKHSNNF